MVQPLSELLNDECATVRVTAVNALGGTEMVAVMESALEDSSDRVHLTADSAP